MELIIFILLAALVALLYSSETHVGPAEAEPGI